ncbi:glycoside hydrolase family 10 protein [Polluticaenibacter yanchengensis]|uniref:Family 10 glycosylhydrolase n=1 Tax=Polluticaenibacter yanchengensis TaxID=3014562 RepID=A0ABT4UHP9_9BACT|nr:family 10 glycosylhydrolase [Chitinophagaceae bacterium LY-5]
MSVRVFINLLILLLISGNGFCQQNKPEFRGAWISTVSNIDWPSKKGLPVEVQKQEFIALLEMHKRNGINALIVQVRPAADALYVSKLEPWSEFLTGTQGLAPSPFYDPMEFMIEETHKRGMEFHAWINPYRAVFSVGKSSIANNHKTITNKDWFITYEGKKLFDPGNPDARNFVLKVVEDIVSRYNIDGFHIDDYFYPYPVPGKPFNDGGSYMKYGMGMNLGDWRRSNVDSAIVGMHRIIKKHKPWIKFGVSPFGVWRNSYIDPRGSNTRGGVTNYDDLYADILLWLKNDWVDYVAPQVYWEIGHRLVDFKTLTEWWAKNSYGKHCYIGIGLYKALDPKTGAAWRDKTMLGQKIELCRNTPGIDGEIFFTSNNFIRNPNGWSDSLRLNYYKEPCATPVMAWLPPKGKKQPTAIKEMTASASSAKAPVKQVENGINAAYKDTSFIYANKSYHIILNTIKGKTQKIDIIYNGKTIYTNEYEIPKSTYNIDLSDFDKNGTPDILINFTEDDPTSYLFTSSGKSALNFTHVEDIEEYPNPKPISAEKGIYYSYYPTDCGGKSWNSDVFRMEKNRAIPLLNMEADGCNNIISSLKITNVNKSAQNVVQTRTFDQAENIEQFLQQFWNNNWRSLLK